MIAKVVTIYLLTTVIAAAQHQNSGLKHFDLECPTGLMARGTTWYAKPKPFERPEYSAKISICVNCQPAKRSNYQWIEICFANTEDILGGQFVWMTLSCKDEKNFRRSNICDYSEPICGLNFKMGHANLASALNDSQPIPCTSIRSIYSGNLTMLNYDIDLMCPKKSRLFGFGRFKLPTSNGFIPVFSVLCKSEELDKSHRHLISISAMGRSNDTEMFFLFSKNPYCPQNTIFASGGRCIVSDANVSSCGIKWKPSQNGEILLLPCGFDEGNQSSEEYYQDYNLKLAIAVTFSTITLMCIITAAIVISVQRKKSAIRRSRENQNQNSERSSTSQKFSGHPEQINQQPYNEPYEELLLDHLRISQNNFQLSGSDPQIQYMYTTEPDGISKTLREEVTNTGLATRHQGQAENATREYIYTTEPDTNAK